MAKNQMNHKIFIINQDLSLISEIQQQAKNTDLELVFFDKIQNFIQSKNALHGNILILDLESLSGDDFDLLLNLSKTNGIIITTEKSEIEFKLMLLEYGIDYFLTTPFDIRELWAYIKNIREPLIISPRAI